ncbi:mitochondrial thiamine pyrophosphate carrier-like [Epargyreus clarus]|uniref:mitochondrial thiamine pyrophosphate carrier-like n=1 Tax=Epargyreus clarus TaxID=520877 RepID=UPI003C2DD51D
MVGYKKDDTMTPNQKLIAGCVSAVTTRFITQPFDVIKIRTQLSRQLSANRHKSVFETTKKIWMEEGITAFWQGHNLGQIHSIASISSQFYVYELSTKYVYTLTNDNGYKAFLIFLCGIFAGCCSATLTVPLEVIRTRQMLVKDQYKGLYNGAKAVYQSGGILAFYEGWSASMLQLGPAIGISFSVFRCFQPLILNQLHHCNGECEHPMANAHKPEHLLLASSIAGSIAGFVSKTATYPLELAKRRLQIGSHKADDKYQAPSTSKNLVRCTKLVDCITTTLRAEGISGLYRGWEVTIYKTQVHSVIAFTTYELLCYFIREVNRGTKNL